MPAAGKASNGALVLGIGIGSLALILWALQLATLADLNSSDAAGNGLAQGFAALEITALWVLLAALAILAFVKGAMPALAGLAALILLPASGAATLGALDLLSEPEVSPFFWPLVIPALVPPLVVFFCVLALLPAMRARVSSVLVVSVVWGAVLVLSFAILPLFSLRYVEQGEQAAQRARWDADFANLPASSPLWDWTPFLAAPDDSKRANVLDRIQHLARRQSDAETMLDRGDFPLLYLGSFDLDPTPELCTKARALLSRRLAPLMPARPNSKPYADVAIEVAAAVSAMEWLVGYDCPCDAESSAWEAMAKSYRDPNFDVVRLAELRDPKNLGRVLNQDPARFSMLTPKAHLKAWLKFADDETLREAALRGARELDRRTADAIDMLGSDEFSANTLLTYLPALDLQATPPLCAAALNQIRVQLAQIYRPPADDLRPYSELLDRMGRDRPLDALQWLAAHGCNANAELTEATSLISAYQDSPDRAAMLAGLAALRPVP